MLVALFHSNTLAPWCCTSNLTPPYDSFRKLVLAVHQKRHPTLEDVSEYWQETPTAKFLFGQDVLKFLLETGNNAATIWELAEEYNGVVSKNEPAPENYLERQKERQRLINWFIEIGKRPEEKFLKYMGFNEP